MATPIVTQTTPSILTFILSTEARERAIEPLARWLLGDKVVDEFKREVLARRLHADAINKSFMRAVQRAEQYRRAQH